MFYRKYGKRIIDFILAVLALIVLSPVFFVLAMLVRFNLGSPIIFKQKRPGLNEKIFTMYKFRTMTDEREDNGELLPDSMRLTKFGKFLRATSLDELPEFWNIISGDMSIVGPRPQLVRDMVFMTPEQRHRHCVLPGLTGWAQVNGRNGISWEEKLLLDLEYINGLYFLKDLEIIFLTIYKVFQRDGISYEGMETAEDYGDYLLRERKIGDDEYCAAIEESKQLMS